MKKTALFVGLVPLLLLSCFNLTAPKKFYPGESRPSNQIAMLSETEPLLQIQTINGKTISEMIKEYNVSGDVDKEHDVLHLLPGEYLVVAVGANPKHEQSLSGRWLLKFTAEAGKKYTLGYDIGDRIHDGSLYPKSHTIRVWIKEWGTKNIVSVEQIE